MRDKFLWNNNLLKLITEFEVQQPPATLLEY